MNENVHDIFRTIQAETLCPFAKSAAITFARSVVAELSVSEAAQQLHEDIVAYVQEGMTVAPDGLVVALPNTVIGDDFESLTSGFNALYRALKISDGCNVEALATENIEDTGWQLTIAGQRLFTNIFSSVYPESNSRHIPKANTTFIFFQPEQSFSTRIPFDTGSIELARLKANIRSRFTQAGLAYEGAITDDPREAVKYLLPQYMGMKAVQWWKSEPPMV